MTKLLVSVLLLCLSAPFAGTYLWLQWEIRATGKEVKRQIQTGLSEKELVFLQLSKTDSETELRWEHSREFEYQGKMYDIVEAETVGDTFYCRCLLDHRETQLKRQLSELLKGATNSDPRSKEHPSRFFFFLKTLYPPDNTDWHTLYVLSGRQAPHAFIFDYHSISPAPSSPPPEPG